MCGGGGGGDCQRGEIQRWIKEREVRKGRGDEGKPTKLPRSGTIFPGDRGSSGELVADDAGLPGEPIVLGNGRRYNSTPPAALLLLLLLLPEVAAPGEGGGGRGTATE